MSSPAPETARPSKRIPPVLLSAGIVLGILGFSVLAYFWFTTWRFQESTNNAYVQAETTPVSARVAGYVVSLEVQDNQSVVEGQVLARIDDREYRGRVEAKRAAIAQIEAEAQAHIERVALQAHAIEEAGAEVAIARAERDRATAELARAGELKRSGNTSKQRYDLMAADSAKADGALSRALAREAASRTELSMLEAEGKRIEAQRTSAQAELALLEIDLEDTIIRAPLAGVVGNRAVRVGQLVEPGRFLLAVVPLDRVWVVANFKETQLKRMTPGQPVTIAVDTFPGATVRGRVESLSPASGAEFSLIPPQNATGNFNKIVQRIPVRIAITDEGPLAGALRPGMSSEVSVDTREAAAPATRAADAERTTTVP